jgi:hypothetical protein
MPMTEEEFAQKARSLYRQASESEKQRIERDKGYFHDWIQRLIGWIGTIWGWICSCCFLTTAVCSKDGRGDDCEELRTLRRFRDEYLLGSGDPSRKKDVDDYYRMAPGIWLWIEGQEHSADFWEIIRGLVSEAVGLIRDSRFHEAHVLYKQGILGLVPCLALGTTVEEEFSGRQTQRLSLLSPGKGG